MSTNANPLATVAAGFTRNQIVPGYTEATAGLLGVNPRGEQLVSQGLPERSELTRLGNSWIIRGAAITCVTAVPTTTAPFSLWNGEPQGGKVYVVDNIYWICTTSAAAASMFALLSCLNVLPVAAQPATTDAIKISSLNGRKYSGRAGMSHTVTVVDDVWVPLGYTNNTNTLTATVGLSLWAPVEGGIIIPPGGLLNLACIAANATAAGQFAVQFHEMYLPNITS